MRADENKIDSLFRDKLEGMETELSPGAIEKMDHFISWQRNRIIFRRLSVAAGLVILMVSLALFLKFHEAPRQNLMSGNEINEQNKQSTKPEESTVNLPVHPNTLLPQSNPKNQSVVKKLKRKKAATLTGDHLESVKVIDSAKQKIEPEKIIISELPAENALAVNASSAKDSVPVVVKEISAKAEVIEKPSPVVIEYIVENKPEKTTNEKTGIAGIFEKAKEIGNEVSYGELRGWKNQLFALNFIKSKRENNNSK